MGQSTDGILFFGIEFGDDFEFPWGDEEFDKWMAAELGVKEPTVPFNEFTKPLFRAYWDEQQEILKSAPVELVMHCSGDYPMYALAVRGTVTRASRGSVETVVGSFTPNYFGLRSFLEKYQLEHDTKNIGWKLASMWR